MTAYATTELRELSAQELDQVTGGLNYNVSEEGGNWAFTIAVSAVVTGIIYGLLDWLIG